MSKLDDMIVVGRKIVGAFYKFWGGPLEACEPMYVSCPGVTPAYLKANGTNCAGLLNFMRSLRGLG